MNKFVLKALAPVALAASLMSTSAAAVVLLDFTIAEGSVPGALANTFTADKMNGGYNEMLTINPDFSFDTSAYANFGQYFQNDGTTLVSPTQVNGLGASNYGIYAIFTASGNFAGTTFTGTSGSFSLYIDTNQDTTLALGANALAGITIGGASDDYLIASTSSLTSAIGVVGNPGAFDLFFKDFLLTTGDQNGSLTGVQDGDSYFTSPRPFHILVNVDGDFDNFAPNPGNIEVTGDVSAVFQVPEPGSIALIGLGLVGLGLSLRRKAV